ncbi:ankyrin repeat domain-containing protein 6 [Cheilinus undulatus]|uniref:ankyrin repeat domain-containing protein 6 n=1 Tax=Cheilinus undulatus TaxID=241271 RepID=UPI001BD2DFCD|nr:ankyrin repeat domain-containing protein 6 [Cheilinus undulatus]
MNGVKDSSIGIVTTWSLHAGNTALHLACQNAHAQTARLLLLEGAKPDTKNKAGDTCLHVAARYNNLTLVKILLSCLCSVNERNQSGDTALHVASALNHKRTVELLLEAGIDGKIRNNAGKTALDKARDNNHKDVAHLLARAPQVHRFMRKTIKKRRERQKTERRTQSEPREIHPNKQDSSSALEETHSSEQMTIQVSPHPQKKREQLNHKMPTAFSNPCSPQQKRRVRVQAVKKDEDVRRRKKDSHAGKDLLWEDDDDVIPALNRKSYQLYTLYRDKDGNIQQAPADGCQCQPLLQKLEVQLKATQEEMRLHILNVQEEVNCRLGQMDRKNKHQIKVLDMLNQERAAADRRNMMYRIEQRVAQGREETLMTQAAVSHELKRWCLSQLKDMEVHVPAKTKYYKLLPSPSVEHCVGDAELESLPLLSVIPGDSSTSLATYVNILPSRSSHSLEVLEHEPNSSGTYFEMKVERSPDDYQNTALFPLPAQSASGLLLGSADPLWQPPGMQDGPAALCRGEGLSSSSSSWSSISDQALRPSQHHDQSFDRNQLTELMSARRRAGIHSEGTRTLEFFIDHPAEPTFIQERNNLHAKEVTQRFFETVSIQLERWYERKIVEVEQQTALRSEEDRKELLQRISMLEEELARLKANENTEILVQLDSE